MNLPKEVVIEYIVKGIVVILVTSIVTWFVIDYTINTLTDGFAKASKTRIDAVDKGYDSDMRLLCLITDCSMLKKKDSGDIFKTNNYLEFNSSSLSPINKAEDYIQFDSLNYTIFTKKRITTDLKMEVFWNIVILLSILTALISTLAIHFKSTWVRRKKIIENKAIENTIQQQLTESLHHEVGGPLTVVECNINALMETIAPCNHILGKEVCDYEIHGPHEECKNCSDRLKLKDPVLEEQMEYYNAVISNIDSIKDILRIVSNTKHLRYTNGNVSIAALLQGLVSSRRFTNFNLMSVAMNNEKIFEDYSLNGDLSNPGLTNVLHALLNNAFEAHANKVIITAEMNADKTMGILYVQDNGHGLLDSKGRLVTNPKDFNQFFKYGFSTKDGDAKIEKNWNLVNIFFNTIFGTVHDVSTTRGAGLAINRNLMRYGGGDLYVKGTSKDGSCFVVTFPIKKQNRDSINPLQ